ncbi:MAG: VCBS repeat-containing protein [Spirochaetales bacterium]|jgi:hypothetical protein|nr:VCBS repeat-containing protein [Spirochaetales bacterium]
MIGGDPIRVGGNRLGPLSTGGVQSIPLGAAFVYGSARPDLFAGGDRWYPGVYLYRWINDENSVPVFSDRRKVTVPRTGNRAATGTVFQTAEGKIYGLWLDGMDIIPTTYDRRNSRFNEEGRIRIVGLSVPPESIGVFVPAGGKIDEGFNVLLGVSNGVPYRPNDHGHREADYRPYDAAGNWRGGFPRIGLYAVSVRTPYSAEAKARLISASDHEVHGGHHSISQVRYGARDHGIVAGSRFGVLHIYGDPSGTPDATLRNPQAQPLIRREVVDTDGVIQRHPACRPSPVSYPSVDGTASDLIVGGECVLQYYRSAGGKTSRPVYDPPEPVLEKDGAINGGSLPVLNVVDWDGDGMPDIVAGNSEGRILFFQNLGSEGRPSFSPGVPLEAGGEEIYVQPGYSENVQGPGEARWGYTCPTVVDWNYDGLPDIVMSDCTARHTVFINRGTRSKPELEKGTPLYLDGLEIHGTWRVKPGVHDVDGQMAYVILDEDDELHLYWRIDNYNLRDGGKLLLEDGLAIRANFLEAGGTGRLKLNLVDWDGDGLIDLIIGTPRHGSVPNPDTGLPQSLGLPGSAVLFLKNTGTNTSPVFDYPRLLHYRGNPVFLGQHSCGPAPAFFRAGEPPDLVVGRENGLFYYFSRSDISFMQPSYP